jgi:glutamyl-tRNA synthetase
VRKHFQSPADSVFRAALGALGALTQWSETSTQAAIEAVAKELGLSLGKVAQPLRVALTGRAASPGIGITVTLVGRERSLVRIERALLHMSAGSGPG